MAKRKRLTPANPALHGALEGAPETKSMGHGSHVPIAEIAGDNASHAALDEMSRQMIWERENGRRVTRVNLNQIKLDYLVRDRAVTDDEEMGALMASIRARGQQVPVDVVAIGAGHYGLISGWRRCQAIARLKADGEGDGTVLALLRKPETASDAYLSMVEENEIRVGLSYFERARIALKSVEQRVFDTEKSALLSLFASASRAKRSKIRSFLPLVRELDGVLRFPHMIGERLGLALSKRMDANADFAADLIESLRKTTANTAEDELKMLADMLRNDERKETLKGGLESKKAMRSTTGYQGAEVQELPSGLQVRLHGKGGRVEIWGEALTDPLRQKLLEWLKTNT